MALSCSSSTIFLIGEYWLLTPNPNNNFRAFLLSYYNTRPRALGTTTVQATGLYAELLRAEITEPLAQIKEFVKKIHSGAIKPPNRAKFSHILCVGIGGSALGPQFVGSALSPLNPPLIREVPIPPAPLIKGGV